MNKEVMAQALEALQHACDAQSNPGRGNFPTIQDFGLMRRAAEVVEAALAAPEQEPAAKPIPPCHVAVIGFRWDGEQQHHVPQLLIEFEPVPANFPNTEKGWVDRDSLANLLRAHQIQGETHE